MKSNKQTFRDTKQLTTHFLKHTNYFLLLIFFMLILPTIGYSQNVIRTRTIEQTDPCEFNELYTFYLSGINATFGKHYQIQSGEFIEYDNGTAHITGLAVNNADSNIKWRIDINLSNRTFAVDPGSVKAPSCLPLNVSDWYLYNETTGTVTGEGSMQGAVANIYRNGPAFQLGTAANETEKNSRFNGSGWLHIEFSSQPNNGIFLENTVGDLNLNLTGSALTQQENCTGRIGHFTINNGTSSITLQHEGSYRIGDLPANSVIEVVANGSHESVGFNVNGAQNEENTVPYNHYWTPAVGTYTISAILFNQDNCEGIRCDEETIIINITDNTTASCTGEIAFFSIANDVNSITLANGGSYQIGDLPANATIRAEATGSHESIGFNVNGAENEENTVPYEHYWTPAVGTYTISASLFNEDNCTGIKCDEKTINITITNNNNNPVPSNLSVDAGADVTICEGDQTQLTANAINPTSCTTSCNITNDQVIARWNMDQCVSFSADGSNESYTEFGGLVSNLPCTSISSTGFYRHEGKHSCTDDGDNNAAGDAVCLGMPTISNWQDNHPKALRFDISVAGGSQAAGITKLTFKEFAPANYLWSQEGYEDNTGINNYPTKYGIRVLKNGVEIFKQINIATSTNSWNLETIDFSSISEFQSTENANYSFELLAYAPIGNGSEVSAWDLDDLLIFGGCCTPTTNNTVGYEWSTGATTTSITADQAGTYQVTVTDCSGAQATDQVDVVINELTCQAVVSQPLTSVLVNDATATASSIGNQGPFSYQWSNGQSSATATNLGAGNYTVTVTDSNGCQCISDITIDGVAAIGNFVWADTNNNGIQDAGEPGISGVVVMLLDGNGNMVGQTTTDQNGQYIFDGLTAGNYKVKFPTSTNTNGSDYILTTPNNGDETKDSDAQPVPNTNDAITETITLNAGDNYTDLDAGYIIGCSSVSFDFSATTTNDLTCNNSNDGQVNLSLNGGSAPYSYNWSNGETTEDLNNLTPGSYLVTVTDDNGCEGTYSVTISEPAAINATATATNVACSGGENGTVQVTVDGGTAPYSYNWNNGATTQSINSLTAGTYNVTVTDANNCSTTASASVDQAGDLVIAVDQTTNVSCNNGNDGSVSISVQGGTAPYSYNWSNGATTEDLTNLSAGDYTGEITDANGCSIAATVTISEPAVLSGLLEIDNITCSGNNSGQINLSVSGGSAPYTYNWSNGETTRNLGDLGPDDYSVTITDAKNCVTELSGEILETAQLEIETQIIGNVTCAGNADGLIDITVVGGTAPYSFNWSNGATSQDISNLNGGNYQVSITDANGCEGFYENTIAEPTTLICSATILANLTTLGGSDARLSASASGGTAPYSYQWSTQQTTAEINNLSAGSYQATITDANGCQCETAIEINNPARVGDYVWEDLNGDGIQDDNEPGIPNVEVTLTGIDANGNNVILTTTTDSNGQYDFDGIIAGTYKITFETPAGFASTPTNVGNDEQDSDALNGMTPEFTIEYGDEDLSFDAGFYNPVNIGNFVWFDADNDGIQDVNEAGVNGVTVSLFDLGPDETFGTADDILVGTQITQTANGTDGNYQFTGVAPGKYAVKFELINLPIEYEFTTPEVSGNSVDSNVDPTTGLTAAIVVVSGQTDDNSIDAGLVIACDVTAAFSTQQKFCEDELAQFTAEDAGAGATYEWVFFNGSSTSSTFIGTRSGHDVPFRFTSPGEKFVKLIVTLPNGCQAVEERLLTVGGNITSGGTIGSDEENCGAFDPAMITNLSSPTGGDGNFEFLWMKSNQSTPPTSIQDPAWEIITDANGLNYDPEMIEETTYYVRCSRMEYCTSYIGESNVVEKSVNGNLVSQFTTDDYICWKRPIEFIADLDEPGVTYQWVIFRGVDQTGTYLGSREGSTMDFTFNQEGAHYLELKVSLPNGCTGTYGEELFVDGYSRVCGDSINFTIVTALNFDAKPEDDGTVLLTWEISNEPNNVQYTVEHSTGDDDFEAIGNVKGDFSENYDFVDDAPMFGINYYRLKYVYADGTVDFSDIKQVVMRFDDKQKVNVFPNPTQDITRLRLAEPDTEDITIELINGQGITLEKVLLPAGETDVEFDLSMYESGHYFIYMLNKSEKSLLSRVMKITD